MTAAGNRRKVLAGLAAVNKRDIPGFTRLLDPGFKLYLIAKPEQLLPQGKVSGPEGFASYLNMLYVPFSDIEFVQQSLEAHGNMVHQELLIRGRHTGPRLLPSGMELPPTGLKIKVPVEVFHTFSGDGGFVSSTGYVYLPDIMKQFRR